MTPTPVTTRAAAGTVRPSWPSYLDALEAAALEVRHRLDEGLPPQMPDLAAPEGPPPPHTERRRDQVLALLVEVSTAVEGQRDTLGGKLAGLSVRPRPGSGYRPGETGSRLDVHG